MKIFLDTEFTDFAETQLISIGLAAASGEVFYSEVPFQRQKCSQFVNEIVLPLLNPEAALCGPAELRKKLIDWFDLVKPGDEEVELCFDFETDWDLFCAAIGDKNIPPWCIRHKIGARNINALMRLDFHRKYDLPEHHALNDAMALRYAFRERPSVAT
jgi:hypothetical protein